jgi:serine/threonine-protein kinase RsbW
MQDNQLLRLKATLENVPLAIDFVDRHARQAGVGNQALYEIKVAVDEACANVVQHAYPSTAPGDMEIVCTVEGDRFVICVRDWGVGFAPETVPTPDVTAPLEERVPGGLGLFLIQQYMEEVEFSFDPATGNRLMMAKRLTRAG